MLSIKSDDKKKHDILKLKEVLKANKCPIMIFGCGVYAKIVRDYLLDNGIENNIRYVVDDEFYNTIGDVDDIITLSKYVELYSKTAPLIFGVYNYEIIKSKREQYKNVIKYMFDFHFAVVNEKNIGWSFEYVDNKIDDFNETYNLLADEKSKGLMEAYINAAVAGEFEYLYDNFKDEIAYFQNYLKDCDINRLFDCGAFDGDSAHDFINAFPNYEYIYEFEPDEKNIRKIQNRIVSEKIRDIDIIAKGVWSESGTLSFSSEGKSSSIICDEGNDRIEVIKLDDLYDRVTKKSLIKMDIEGSELQALIGAERIISEKNPALAICVYHRLDDLITIPQYIDSLVKAGIYKYFLGYQGDDLAELVFYAIPLKNV